MDGETFHYWKLRRCVRSHWLFAARADLRPTGRGGDENGEESVRHEAKRALERANDERSEEKIPKGIAILFGFDPPPGDFTQPQKIMVANLSMSIDLSDRPLIWLGRAQDEESVLFLEQFFINVKSIKLKERLLFAISIHDSSERAQKILRDLVVQSDHERLRASAAFFLGERNRDEDISLLQKVILHDRSREVREKAVFGLSRMQPLMRSSLWLGMVKKGT
jgi:hypothetical protein